MGQHNFYNKRTLAQIPAEGMVDYVPGTGYLRGWKAASSPSAEGFAKGALFQDTTNGNLYINDGTSTTASWSLIGGRSFALEDDETITMGDGSDVVLKWNGTYLEGGPSTGLWATAPSPADPRYHQVATEFFDDFNYKSPDDAGLIWTEVDDAGTGTNTIADAGNGVATIVTAATDNDHHAVTSIAQSWLFAAGKKLWFEARFKLAEAATNESAWWFGLSDTLTTGGLQANNAGPLASYDGVLIWKDEGTMTIDFETSNAGTQATASASLGTFVTNTWSRVGFYFDGTATTSNVIPYVDVGAGFVQGETETITLAGLAEMSLVLGAKAGPSGGAETLSVDYVKCVQLR